jgi:hypothetical protein
MRKVFSFPALAAMSLLFMQSCEKMDMHDKGVTTTQTVNASISQNSSYTYTLPSSVGGSTSQISTPAAHSSVSTITTDINGNNSYHYTPAAGYAGNDIVVITTKTEEAHGGHGNCNHGGHGHHDDDDNTTITTINLTVTSASVTTSK